ncbi:hypothetical protein ISN45_At01g017010 [Arabidopsis thaliana x Arabidopsis arenosa]|uniref:Uncharacterized protein n=2 Tax=Arabidopsis TaxID=3701 RepID=A0A8T2H5A5_ARASU|nr:hypothetical protein ISN45_At01g017010 [Arabidopsis thaliana x Arabidopsis arenosa]KAG7654550.1 hypothetical protein ISN44_As01g017190 [Arabidopsis suecica]
MGSWLPQYCFLFIFYCHSHNTNHFS